jgi:Effector Associated Constant Component 1
VDRYSDSSKIRLSVEGGDPVGGVEELSEWLRLEPQLRGLVTPETAAPKNGQLGPLTEVLIAAVGSGGTVSVLAAALQAFLVQPRRADVRIVLTAQGGRRVEIDAKHVDDVEAVLRRVLEQPE